MFETIAVIGTLSCVIIFVALFQLDRVGRREESARRQQSTDATDR